MGREEMRAADADRQAVADQLRVALDEGRLDLHEYDERLQRAYAAKTYGDLDGLLTDLPARLPEPAAPQPQPSSDVTRRWLVHVWSGYSSVVSITVGIWLIASISAGDPLYFWPVWVAGPWGIMLIWQTVAGLSQQEPQKWQAKLDKAERKKQLKKERKALERKALEREALERDASAGELSAGGPPAGKLSAGELSAGELSAGGPPAGELSAGDRSVGEPSAGDRSVGDLSAGERPATERAKKKTA